MTDTIEKSNIAQSERIYVDSDCRITHYENNLVTLTLANGDTYEALEPRHLFPISSPKTYISLLDQNGAEVALIRALDALNEESEKCISASLSDYYRVPKITKIISVSEKYGTLRWTVETDRGIKKFDIRNRNHDIKVAENGSVRLRDSDDNRYVIEDYKKLDSHSRAQLIADL